MIDIKFYLLLATKLKMLCTLVSWHLADRLLLNIVRSFSFLYGSLSLNCLINVGIDFVFSRKAYVHSVSAGLWHQL